MGIYLQNTQPVYLHSLFQWHYFCNSFSIILLQQNLFETALAKVHPGKLQCSSPVKQTSALHPMSLATTSLSLVLLWISSSKLIWPSKNTKYNSVYTLFLWFKFDHSWISRGSTDHIGEVRGDWAEQINDQLTVYESRRTRNVRTWNLLFLFPFYAKRCPGDEVWKVKARLFHVYSLVF